MKRRMIAHPASADGWICAISHRRSWPPVRRRVSCVVVKELKQLTASGYRDSHPSHPGEALIDLLPAYQGQLFCRKQFSKTQMPAVKMSHLAVACDAGERLGRQQEGVRVRLRPLLVARAQPGRGHHLAAAPVRRQVACNFVQLLGRWAGPQLRQERRCQRKTTALCAVVTHIND